MTKTEAYDAVREILEAHPGESLNDAAHRAKRQLRSGRWAAVRLLAVSGKPEHVQWPEIEAIARKGKYR